MFHRFRRVIIMLIVSTILGMPQGQAQDTRSAVEAAPAGLEEVLPLATAHTSAGRFAEGQQVLETALETTSTPEAQHALRLALAELHAAWARQLEQRFAYTDARAQYQAALALRRALGDRAGEGTLLDRLGITHRAQSQYREAIAYFEQALERQRALGDRAGESATLTHLGEAYDGLSQYPQAIAVYEQAWGWPGRWAIGLGKECSWSIWARWLWRWGSMRRRWPTVRRPWPSPGRSGIGLGKAWH
jgi:tetratricopeptide (TPR) repeat protein